MGQIWSFVGLGGRSCSLPKKELEGWSKNRTQKCDEDEIKGVQKWSRRSRDILILVFKVFSRSFSPKEVVNGQER